MKELKINPPKSLHELENLVSASGRKERTETAILGTLALTGVLTVAILAPKTMQILKYIVPDTSPLSHKQSIRRAIGRLINNNYIQKTEGKYKLTKKGTARLDTLLQSAIILSNSRRKTRWDKKWRIVIFDVKETRRSTRNELRKLLSTAGFIKLQESVWVFPFRCDEIISLLKFKLTLGYDLVYIIADAIEGDEKLKKHFGIK